MHSAIPTPSATEPPSIPPTIAPADGGCLPGVNCDVEEMEVDAGVEGDDVANATLNFSGVGAPLFAGTVAVPSKHSPNAELMRLHLMPNAGSTHPEAEATTVRWAVEIIVCVVKLSSMTVIIVFGLRA
ncbi:hypothetical protein B0H19DRAFT_1151973 [Mycena capillaripes]|nr:hypothetical protein B0H19DRAFT_1151973 [Mycena capillaripes]